MKVLVLDAMGVIYPVGDDVRNLLCPFISSKHGAGEYAMVEEYYNKASIGEMTARDLWEAVGIDPQLEDEYLTGFKLTPGLLDFLKKAESRGIEIWCLSNDLAEWSQKLRKRFGLQQFFRGVIISGDVGLRKPNPMIFRLLLERSGVPAKQLLFVDDNPKNIVAAAALGIDSVLFSPAGDTRLSKKYRRAAAFDDILPLLD
jgi:HAD superfamily hydrolase (TIGR01509 family)